MRLFKKKSDTQADVDDFSENSTLPIRHPSFRWDDEHLAISARHAAIFPLTVVGLRRNEREAA